MRILCCKEASPDEIQMMFTKLKEREEAFQKCLHALQHADPPNQPVEEPNAMISAFFQSHKAKNSKWAACPSCACRYQTNMQHDCMKALNRKINKLQEALNEQQEEFAALKEFCHFQKDFMDEVQNKRQKQSAAKEDDVVYTIVPEESE